MLNDNCIKHVETLLATSLQVCQFFPGFMVLPLEPLLLVPEPVEGLVPEFVEFCFGVTVFLGVVDPEAGFVVVPPVELLVFIL